MRWSRRPDPIAVLEQALAASRADREAMARQLGERAGEAIVRSGAIERLEEELVDLRVELETAEERLMSQKKFHDATEGRVWAELNALRSQFEASERHAREIGEARDQLVGERDHAQHKVEALLEAADTFYHAAVDISYKPEPGKGDDAPESEVMMQCPGEPACDDRGCRHRGVHAKNEVCGDAVAGCPCCTPVPIPTTPPAPELVICKHADICDRRCLGKHYEPHERRCGCELGSCTAVDKKARCVPAAGEEKPT